MSTIGKRRPDGDDTPVVGPGGMPDFLRNDSLPHLHADVDQVTADLIVLISNNPRCMNFRATDLSNLDDQTKRALLVDLQESLDIKSPERIRL